MIVPGAVHCGSESEDTTTEIVIGDAGGAGAGAGGGAAGGTTGGTGGGAGATAGASGKGGTGQAGFPGGGGAGSGGGAGAGAAGKAGQGGAGAGGSGGTSSGGTSSGGTGGSAPVTDACAKAGADGEWCGSALSVASQPNTLFHCQGGKTIGATPCATTCHVTTGNDSDYCDTATQADPCAGATSGDGPYCGGTLNPPGDAGTLFTCKGKKTAGKQVCANGCHVSPPGQADYCNGAPSTDPCSGASSGDGAYCGGALPGGNAGTLYQCAGGKTAGSQVCSSGCHSSPAGQADYCESGGTGGAGGQGPGGGTVDCNAKQWWNAAITYGPYQDYNPGSGVTYWWDTDLAVSASSPVQLRHDSKLVAEGVHPWGWQPTFVDQVTGKTFQFLHLRPQNKYATQIGKVYPSGTIVGLSGGDTTDTGYPKYSSGAHLCVQTPDTWESSFPKGVEPCK